MVLSDANLSQGSNYHKSDTAGCHERCVEGLRHLVAFQKRRLSIIQVKRLKDYSYVTILLYFGGGNKLTYCHNICATGIFSHTLH